MDQPEPLLRLLKDNISMHFKTSGFRSEYHSVLYEPKGSLHTFLDLVLPEWSNPAIGNQDTEEHATECLDMLRIADVVYRIIRAYGLSDKYVYVTDDFTKSPVVMGMLRTLWDTDFDVDQLQQLKKVKMFADLIITRCPNFVQLYHQKKAEYDSLVHMLDKSSISAWSHDQDMDTDADKCTCGHASNS